MGAAENVRNPVSTLAIVRCPWRVAIYENSRGLVHIRVVRSRLPGALEFRLQKHFAYQATYFLVINSIRGMKKKMLKKQKPKHP